MGLLDRRARDCFCTPGPFGASVGAFVPAGDTGAPTLTDAFLDAGASAYIAPSGAPFGYAGVFAPLFLFYELTEQRTLTEAVTRLRAHDGELGMWDMRHRH
ncbi:hypothetical protein AABB02_16660 [Streptomyces rimosus]|uniref:hypothetical protein n=1 Tax=Streptomyces rimosus TaxID=1927 RepID=UPI0031CE3885